MSINQPDENPNYDYPAGSPAGSGIPDRNVDYIYNPAASMAAGDPGLNPAVGEVITEGPYTGRANAETYMSAPGPSRGDQATTGADAAAASDAPPETAQIRAEIEGTRSQMSSTIDAIQERLSPGNLVDQAKDSVREATIGRVQNMANDARDTVKEAGNSFWETVKENPLPAALAAVSFGWLFMKSREKGSRQSRTVVYDTYAPRPSPTYDRYGYSYAPGYRASDYGSQRQGGGPGEVVGRVADRAGNVAGNVGDTVGEAAGNVADAVGGAAGNVRDAAGNVRDAAGNVVGRVGDTAGALVDNVQQGVGNVGSGIQSTAQQAGTQFQRWLYESPLAVGAAAVVLGAAVGLAIPETEPEHKFMGEARDTLVEKAQSAASQAVDKVTQVAQEAGNAAQQAAKQEAQNQGLTPQ